MRVCILTHTFPRFSGDTSAPFMYGVAEGIAKAGNEVFVLAPFSDKFRWKRSQLPFKLVTYKYIWPKSLHRLGYSETLTNDMKLPLMMWFLSPFMYVFGFISLLKLVKKEKIDLINAHWILPNGFIASVVSLFTGVSVVSTLPGSDVYMAGRNILFKTLAKFAASRSRWITSNSQQLISDLEKETQQGLKTKSSVVIYGVDPKKFKPSSAGVPKLKKSLGITAKNIVILGVGRLVAKKGFRYLIKVVPMILKKAPQALFVIVGDGDEKDKLVSYTKNLKVDKSLKFVGSVNYKALIDYYNLSDIFVLPSVRDEKGNLDDQSVSVIEAMACGKPVVTSNFPGYRIVVDEGKNGFLVKEKSPKDLSDAILRLIRKKSIRMAMGRESRKRIVREFSWDAVGAAYTRLFAKIRNPEFYSKSVPKILFKNERVRIAKQIYNVLSAHLGQTKKLSCLDIGCSSGVITNYLARHFKKIVGVDVDNEALSLAKKNYNRKNLNFINMNSEKLTFKDESFDVVVANQVYEFVSDDQKVFDEIYRVLKPEGVCFVGARNKYAFVEDQYKLPFFSWLPKISADIFIRLLGKGEKFVGNYRSYWDLLRLVRRFTLYDYTARIIKNPHTYGYKRLEKYSFLKFFPIEILRPLFPNYIWILEK